MIYVCVRVRIYIIEGSLEVKLPTIWTDKKQRWEEPEKRREEKRRRKKIKKRKSPSPKKEDSGGRRGSESRLAKAAGAEPCGQMREGKLHAVVARSTFASEKAKNTTRSHISK